MDDEDKPYTLDDLMAMLDDEPLRAIEDVLQEYDKYDAEGNDWDRLNAAKDHLNKALDLIAPVWRKQYGDD